MTMALTAIPKERGYKPDDEKERTFPNAHGLPLT